jgi:hypothetical protein
MVRCVQKQRYKGIYPLNSPYHAPICSDHGRVHALARIRSQGWGIFLLQANLILARTGRFGKNDVIGPYSFGVSRQARPSEVARFISLASLLVRA